MRDRLASVADCMAFIKGASSLVPSDERYAALVYILEGTSSAMASEILGHAGASLAQQTYSEFYGPEHFGHHTRQAIVLKHWPVVQVIQVLNNQYQLDPSSYYVLPQAGLLRLIYGRFFEMPGAVNVQYVAGYPWKNTPPASPALSTVTGGTLSDRTYYVQVTYVLSDGTETSASAESSIAVGAGTLAVVQSPQAQTWAIGWNVYAGTSSGAETKQNASPIALGQNWQEPGTGLVSSGAAPPQIDRSAIDVPVDLRNACLAQVTFEFAKREPGGALYGATSIARPDGSVIYAVPDWLPEVKRVLLRYSARIGSGG